MALTRKFLKALGIEEEKIEEIITAHTETVNGLKGEADKVNELKNTLESVSKERDDLKSKYDENAKGEIEKLNGRIKELENEKVLSSKKSAYSDLLKNAGINEKHIKSVIRICDFNGIEIDENGKIKNSEEITKNIKTEFADFITVTKNQGASAPTPPENEAAVDFDSMSDEEYYKYKETHK